MGVRLYLRKGILICAFVCVRLLTSSRLRLCNCVPVFILVHTHNLGHECVKRIIGKHLYIFIHIDI